MIIVLVLFISNVIESSFFSGRARRKEKKEDSDGDSVDKSRRTFSYFFFVGIVHMNGNGCLICFLY